jgi:hypothetical protein
MKRNLQRICLCIGLTIFSVNAFGAVGGEGGGAITVLPGSNINAVSTSTKPAAEVKTTAQDATLPAAAVTMPAMDAVAPAPEPIPIPPPAPQDDALNSVLFYPNPVKDVLTVRFPKKGTYTVLIYNILGDKVMEKTVSDESEIRLNMTEMQNGLFFLNYEWEGKAVSKRFSKSS